MNRLTAAVCAFALLGCVSDGIAPDDDPGGGGGEGSGGGGGSGGSAPEGMLFGPYKDTSINMDWNTNIISTLVSGTRTPLVTDMKTYGAKLVTLSFATGECGSETWGGVPGTAMATANRLMLVDNGIDYILATGGAAGSFTCSTDAGMNTFIERWMSPNLIGIDYDIEAGQSEAQIGELIQRIIAAHAKYPKLRWQLTLATLANNDGSPTAKSQGASAPSSFNIKGNRTTAHTHKTH